MNGGGRPRATSSVVLKVSWHVLTIVRRSRDVPPDMGRCGNYMKAMARDWSAVAGTEDMLRPLRMDGKLEQGTAIVNGLLVYTDGVGKNGIQPRRPAEAGSRYTLMVGKTGSCGRLGRPQPSQRT